MCTQDEIREVIREVAPVYTKYLVGVFVAGVMTLLGWVLYEVHNQDTNISTVLNKQSKEISKQLSHMELSYSNSNIEIMGKIGRIDDNMDHLKDLVIDKTLSVAREAKAREKLVDERCSTFRKRLEDLEDAIERHHNSTK